MSMLYYIDEIIYVFDRTEPRGCGIKTTVSPEDLYKVDEKFENFSTDKAKIFHNILSNTLYNTNRESPDTCTAVAFLTTIVREPNKDDWGKLVHVMK